MNKNLHSNNILLSLGIESLNKMQVAAETSILFDSDVVLLSPTGSGKTLAFLLPIFQLLEEDNNKVQCMIIVPSRELGLQIEQVWKKMATTFKVNICYGGHSIETEIKNLSNPPAVLIGTPGRLADHLERETFDPKYIKTLVLDEFDKSLQLGFHEEMRFIIGKLTNLEKRILVSATDGVEVPKYTRIENPNVLNYIDKKKTETNLDFKLVISKEKDKVNSLFHLICSLKSQNAIIFCNHREAVERISDYLNDKGIFSVFYHGGLEQREREHALYLFKSGCVDTLICTDLASRGLDIPELDLVIHYQFPHSKEDFIHRNGRTARMKAEGTVLLIHSESEPLPDYCNDFEINKIKGYEDFKDFKPSDKFPVYLSAGRKDKIRKIDIVGFFTKEAGIKNENLGLIEVYDQHSLITLSVSDLKIIKNLMPQVKIKKQKIKISFFK